MLELHQQPAIKSVEAGLYFTSRVIAGLGTQLYYIWQGRIKLLVIVNKAMVGHHTAVEVGKTADYVLVHLQVSLLGHILAAHHVNQRLIPLGNLVLGGIVDGIWVDYTGLDFVEVEAVGTNQVFNLPHIQQILGYIFFTFLRSNYHNSLAFLM